MNCLDQEQLARLLLEPGADDSAAAHAAACPTCGARLAQLRAIDQQLSQGHAQFEVSHGQQRLELLAALGAEDRAAQGRPRSSSIATYLRGLTMGQKTILGGVGAAALALAVFAWTSSSVRQATAMERMAESIRRAKSWQATVEFEKVDERQGPGPLGKLTMTYYWQAPGTFRTEADAVDHQMTDIYHRDKPGISIDHVRQRFHRTRARQGQMPPTMLLDQLGRFAGQADRELGVREVDGKAARGFVVDIKKIDRDIPSGEAEIWIDTDTDLPVLLRYRLTSGIERGTMTFRDFRWNVEFDPTLFDTTPPEGYVDATRKPVPIAERVRAITESLRVYAELAGEYPQVKTVYADVARDEMYRMIGIQNGRPTAEQRRSKLYDKVQQARSGFTFLNSLVFRQSPDGAYYGLSVGPGDADKVLVRWQLDDGRYQVIYGDLRDEIVSAERLRELERASE